MKQSLAIEVFADVRLLGCERSAMGAVQGISGFIISFDQTRRSVLLALVSSILASCRMLHSTSKSVYEF